MIGIYKITNMNTGKCYVGQSIDIEKRWKQTNIMYHQNVIKMIDTI